MAIEQGQMVGVVGQLGTFVVCLTPKVDAVLVPVRRIGGVTRQYVRTTSVRPMPREFSIRSLAGAL